MSSGNTALGTDWGDDTSIFSNPKSSATKAFVGPGYSSASPGSPTDFWNNVGTILTGGASNQVNGNTKDTGAQGTLINALDPANWFGSNDKDAPPAPWTTEGGAVATSLNLGDLQEWGRATGQNVSQFEGTIMQNGGTYYDSANQDMTAQVTAFLQWQATAKATDATNQQAFNAAQQTEGGRQATVLTAPQGSAYQVPGSAGTPLMNTTGQTGSGYYPGNSGQYGQGSGTVLHPQTNPFKTLLGGNAGQPGQG